jgi:hypothetical protein
METQVIYVTVPARLKGSLEDLALKHKRAGHDPHTLTALVVKACDDMLVSEAPGYHTLLNAEANERGVSRVMTGKGTHAEQIMRAVAAVVTQDGKDVFTRAEIRDQAAIDRERWLSSFTPIFQGMRADQPGGAPQVGSKYKAVFRQISHGRHMLTSYGQELIKEYAVRD